MEDILLYFTNYQNNSKYSLTQLFYYKTINNCLKNCYMCCPAQSNIILIKMVLEGGEILLKHNISFCRLDFILTFRVLYRKFILLQLKRYKKLCLRLCFLFCNT